MSNRIKNSNHTGKTNRKNDVEITLDSNMVGYLYLLSKDSLSMRDMLKLEKLFTNEQLGILNYIVAINFKGIKFKTTPQVIREVEACAKIKGDDGIVKFLERICKIKIPRTRADKEKYAEFIINLMEEYLIKDIPNSKNLGQMLSAIASEEKKGEENFADARIIAENTALNGCPVITKNEKHLISMPMGRYNNLRSFAILDKNRKVLKNPKVVIPHKRVKTNLKSDYSTTFRINELPYLMGR